MAVAAVEMTPPLYDPVSHRFDVAALRRAMGLRRLTHRGLCEATGLSKNTVTKAMAGEVIWDATAYAILGALEDVTPGQLL